MQALVAKFNSRYPFVKVEVVRLANPPLIARVEAEAAANRLTADLMETTDINDAKKLENIFEDYSPPNAALFPADSQISKRFWPMCGVAYVVMINTALVKKPLQSLDDMLSPELKGKVGTVLPGAGGTSWSIALMQRLKKGDDWWNKFAAQEPLTFQSSVPLGTAIASGEIYAGFAPLIAVTPIQKQGAPVAAIGLDDGIPSAVTAGGIVKGAKNANAARLFMDWATSEEGQTTYSELGCASVLPGIKLPTTMKVDKGKVWVPPFAAYADRQAPWIADWNKIYKVNP
jgi:iron(III) transport system substrate-binding protein